MYEYCINSEILFSTYDLRRHIRIMKARMNHHKSIGGKVGYFKNQIKILEEKLLKIQQKGSDILRIPEHVEKLLIFKLTISPKDIMLKHRLALDS